MQLLLRNHSHRELSCKQISYVDAATQMSESCGGGGGTGTGWGKKDDEDELEWARRCAMKANWLCKPILRVRKRN